MTDSAPAFFPVLSAASWHHLFEIVAFAVAGRIAWQRAPRQVEALADHRLRLVVLAGAIAGAGIGAKALYALQFAGDLAFHHAPIASWLAGKTVVGGFLGAIAGVEIAKRAAGLRERTGDAFVLPLAVGMAIGRLGCFAAGLADGTYGIATRLPWGIDFGDGVPRHPTPLYEASFVLALGLLLSRARAPMLEQGDRFRLYAVGSLSFRFAIDFLKPPFGPETPLGEPHLRATLYGGWLTAIQLACLLGVALYAPAAVRALVRERARPR